MKARDGRDPRAVQPRLARGGGAGGVAVRGVGQPGKAAAWKAKLGLADLPADVFARP